MNIKTAAERLTIRSKLVIGFGYLLLFLVVLALQSLNVENHLNGETQQVYERELLGLSHLKETHINLIYMGRAVRQCVLAPNPAERERARHNLTSAEQNLTLQLDEALNHTSEQRAREQLDQFEILAATYKGSVERALEMSDHQGQKAASDFMASSEYQQAPQRAEILLAEVSRDAEQRAQTAARHADALYRQSRQNTAVLACLGLLGLPFALLIGASVRDPISRLRRVVERLAAGQLEAEVPHTEYPNEVGAVARAIQVLQLEARQIEEQRWIKDHLARLSVGLQQATSMEQLGSRLLSELAPTLGVVCGALFLWDQEQSAWSVCASYAMPLPPTSGLAEGLVGQCARDLTSQSFSLTSHGLSLHVLRAPRSQ